MEPDINNPDGNFDPGTDAGDTRGATPDGDPFSGGTNPPDGPTGPTAGDGGPGTPAPPTSPTGSTFPDDPSGGDPRPRPDNLTFRVRSTPATGASIYVNNTFTGQTTDSNLTYTIDASTMSYQEWFVSVQANNSLVTGPLKVEYNVSINTDGSLSRNLRVINEYGNVVQTTTGTIVDLDFTVSPFTPRPPANNYTITFNSIGNVFSTFINGQLEGIPTTKTYAENSTVYIDPQDLTTQLKDFVDVQFYPNNPNIPSYSLPVMTQAEKSMYGGGPNARKLTVTTDGTVMLVYNTIIGPPPPPINQPPTAEANGPYSAQVGQAIQFTSMGSDDPDGLVLAYAWDFGDGTFQNGPTPSKAYSQTGTYTARLTVTDLGGLTAQDTAQVTITAPGVDPPPVPPPPTEPPPPTQPPPPPTEPPPVDYRPVIVQAPSDATYSIPEGQEDKDFVWPIHTLYTNRVRVTIPGANYIREFTVNRRADESPTSTSALNIVLNYIADFSSKGFGPGQYVANFTPIGDGLVEGDTVSMPLTLVPIGLIPAISTVIYPNIVRIPAYVYNDKTFRIGWTSENADRVRLESLYTNIGDITANGEVQLNFRDLVNRGADYGPINFTLTPFRGERIGEPRTITIFFEEPAKLSRSEVVRTFVQKYDALINFEPEYNKIAVDYRWNRNILNCGNDDNHLIVNFMPDDVTFPYEEGNHDKAGSILLKFYDPLPSDVEVNNQYWISFQETYPYIDSVILSDKELRECIPLRPYDSDVEIEGITGWQMGFETFNQLITSGSATSQNLIDKYLSGSVHSKDLGIDYTEFDNFVHFSSAYERLTNFRYKLQLVETYDGKIADIDASSASSSFDSLQERESWLNKKRALIGGFDGYEKHLYEQTGSTAWPKTGSLNYHSTSSTGIAWYASQSAVATTYDNNNQDYLVNNVPSHVVVDAQNEEYLLFLSMVGHHFDILWTYINALRNIKNVTHQTKGGVPDELLHHMLRSLGWDIKNGIAAKQLWKYAFGMDEDGNVTEQIAGENYAAEVWRRILNNLPYLLKHKGTARALRALVSCYGIPASILSIKEYGGPTPTGVDNAEVSSYTFQDQTTALNFVNTSRVTIPWINTSLSRKPDAVEIRVRTTDFADQNILQNSSGDWTLRYLATTASYNLGKVELTVSGTPTTVFTSSELPLYDGTFYSILINRSVGTPDTFTLYVKNTIDGKIRQRYSGSFGVSSSGWNNDTELYMGSGSGGTFVGQVDEFRLWTENLSEAIFDTHVLYPESFAGSHVSSSTEDLEFRLSFNNPKNEAQVGGTSYISSSAPEQSYATFATASGFTTSSSYPYSYYYHVRVNDAKVPSVGGSRYFNNKVRFESQELTGDLDPYRRATKKAFDRAPVDLNKVGVFFSPTDVINRDILRAFGYLDLTDYIADPENIYAYDYDDLDTLNRYYWARYGNTKPDIWEYIRLIRYFDTALFDYIKAMVPARTHLYTGLTIEPTLLERNRGYRHRKPSKEELTYDALYHFSESVVMTGSNDQYDADFDGIEFASASGNKFWEEGIINPEILSGLSGSKWSYDSDISFITSESVSGSYDTYTNEKLPAIATSESVQKDLTLFLSTTIGTELDPPIDPYWGIPQTLFGLYVDSGSTQMIYNKDGMQRRRRVKVELVEQTSSYFIRQLVSGSDQSGPYVDTLVSQSFQVLNIIDITGSHTPGATILDGYRYPYHYRYTKDISTGMENSFYYGVKNSIATTIDGGTPVEEIESSPNQLRVNKVGRSSAEPILEVD